MSKTFAIAAVLVVGTVNGYATPPNYCPNSELTNLGLVAFTNAGDLSGCKDASGWQFIPPVAEPTPDQKSKMCGSQACKDLLAAVKARNPQDCFLSLSRDNKGVNVKKLVDEFTC